MSKQSKTSIPRINKLKIKQHLDYFSLKNKYKNSTEKSIKKLIKKLFYYAEQTIALSDLNY